MAYVPTGWFCTKHRLRMMLAECAAVQTILLAADADEALARIATYSQVVREYDADGNLIPPEFVYPRILLHEESVVTQTDDAGKLLDIEERIVQAWISFYVPDDVEGVETITDEEGYVRQKFSEINSQLMDLVGTGEPVPGETHLMLSNPTFHGVEREANDERGDEETDPYPDLARWFGLLEYEVR